MCLTMAFWQFLNTQDDAGITRVSTLQSGRDIKHCPKMMSSGLRCDKSESISESATRMEPSQVFPRIPWHKEKLDQGPAHCGPPLSWIIKKYSLKPEVTIEFNLTSQMLKNVLTQINASHCTLCFTRRITHSLMLLRKTSMHGCIKELLPVSVLGKSLDGPPCKLKGLLLNFH